MNNSKLPFLLHVEISYPSGVISSKRMELGNCYKFSCPPLIYAHAPYNFRARWLISDKFHLECCIDKTYAIKFLKTVALNY